MVAQIPAGIARAKGIVQAGGIYLLNCVMGKTKLEKIDQKEGMGALLNKVVFIGPPEAMQQLDRKGGDQKTEPSKEKSEIGATEDRTTEDGRGMDLCIC